MKMEIIPPSSIASKVDYSNRKQEQWEDYVAEAAVAADYTLWDDDDSHQAINELATRLEEELRAAKSNHFSAGEVLLPFGLLQAIAADIVREAEHEPCGLRGCRLILQFTEDQRGSSSGSEPITLGVVDLDSATAPTFEVKLLLKQSAAGWNNFLPQFLKKITRGGTVMIDSNYKMEKNQLYRQFYN